jgi:hypothetical protein
MKADHIHFRRPSNESRMTNFEWMPIRNRNVIAVLKNPFYAGVCVYGKSEKRTAIIDGRVRKSYGHGKPIGTWEVMFISKIIMKVTSAGRTTIDAELNFLRIDGHLY